MEEMNSYICLPIDEEDGENGYKKQVEKWKMDLFSDMWKRTKEEECIGSRAVIKYAPNMEELLRMLEPEYETPPGLSLLHEYEMGYRNHRIYVSRKPIVLSIANLDNVFEYAKALSVLHIDPKDVAEVFGDDYARDLEHVTILNDECVYRPPRSDKGMGFIAYDPKMVGSLRTRYSNEKIKAERNRVAAEKRTKENSEKAAREDIRLNASEKRKESLDILNKYIGNAITYVFNNCNASSATCKISSSSYMEFSVASELLGNIKLFDVFKEPFVNYLNSKRGNRLKDFPVRRKKARSILIKADKIFSVYENMYKNRKNMPTRDDFDPEVDKPDDKHKKQEKKMAKVYKELYKKLLVLQKSLKRKKACQTSKKPSSPTVKSLSPASKASVSDTTITSLTAAS